MSRQNKPKPVRLPSYCLHKPSGRAYVTLGGKMTYLGRYKLDDKGQPDCPEYHRLIAEWLKNGRSVPLAPPTPESPITVVELLAQYWTYCEGYYKRPDGAPSGELSAILYAIKPVKQLFGDEPAQAFGPKRLKMVREEMIKLGWARTNINRQMSRVKKCFRWGGEEELIPGSVYQNLSTLRALRCNPAECRESDPVRPVPGETMEATLPFLSPTVAAMVRLQCLTGMRPGELVIMRMCDIEMASNAEQEEWTYRPARHKNTHRGQRREIPLGPKARDILRPFLKPGALESFIFDTGDGQTGYTVSTYRRAIARACDRAFPLPADLQQAQEEVQAWVCQWAYANNNFRPRLECYPAELRKKRDEIEAFLSANRWHPHQLRHSAATNLKKRFGVEAARLVLGHADADMTTQYAENDREQARAFMEQVG